MEMLLLLTAHWASHLYFSTIFLNNATYLKTGMKITQVLFSTLVWFLFCFITSDFSYPLNLFLDCHPRGELELCESLK